MIKKGISSLVLSTFLIGLFPINSTYAEFNLNDFRINNVNNSQEYFNPWDTFSIDAGTTNAISGDSDINNVRVNIDFQNNQYFSYTWNDQRWRINWVNTVNPFPISSYSSTNWFNWLITSDTVTSGSTIQISRTSNHFNAFSISWDISTYQNTVEMFFQANRVSDNLLINWTPQTKTFYVNVKPHIIDKYFEKDGTVTTTIKWNGAEFIDFIVKVKDYNWCSNIDNSQVTADLSPLWLWNSETLNFESCDSDGKTAFFKKSNISTIESLGVKNFSYTNFSITDEDGNQNNPSDSNFSESWETNDINITVESPGAPEITSEGLTDNYIWSDQNTSADFSFSSNQSGNSKISLDSCTQSDSNKIIQDWTSYSWSTIQTVTISRDILSEWNNSIFVCVDNWLWNTWSYNFNITKDTQNPTIELLSYTANITTKDVEISYKCNENGYYKVETQNSWGTTLIRDYTSILANIETEENLAHSNFELWVNTLYVYCKDEAENEVFQTGSITKHQPTPSMLWEVTSFIDNDIDNNGLDGRDIRIDWNTTVGENFTWFESWRIYLLPSSTSFDAQVHNYIGIIPSSSSGTFISDENLTTDSAWNTLLNQTDYKAYVAIMWTSWELWTQWESPVATLVSDTIQQAQVLSAEFIWDTQLKIYTDTTLDTDVNGHWFSWITFTYNSSSIEVTWVDSIDGQNMVFNIPSLGYTAATATNLFIPANSIHSEVWWFNEDLNPNFTISDKQKPIISAFTNNSVSTYNDFFTWSINIWWNTSEDLFSGDTQISFNRISGNIDNSTHSVNITNSPLLTSWSHTLDIRLDSNTSSDEVLLTCGTRYSTVFTGKDLNGNIQNSSAFEIKFDNCAPTIPVITEKSIEGDSDVNFSWTASVDDNWFGSGVKEYTLEIFNGNSCVNALSNNTISTVTTFTKNLTDGDYSWKIKATDYLGNTSDYSHCDDFSVDSQIPTFSNLQILDVQRNDTQYLKWWNTVRVSADILNTDINNITADLSSLTWDANHNSVSCNTPDTGITCTYNSSSLTYEFISWFAGTITQAIRQVNLTANNTSGINTQNTLISTTVDTTAPSVSNSAISFPNGWETVGWDSLEITWNTNQISDIIWIKNIEIYSKKWWILGDKICEGWNIWTCEWNLDWVISWNDYEIEIHVTDNVDNISTDISDGTFSIDKNPPSITTDTIISPNGWEIFQGGENITILWDHTKISDGAGLKVNPITLEYTDDNWTTYTQIATNLANNGNYEWLIPNINSGNIQIKITAEDNVGNTSNDISDTVFIIDSTDPILSIDFAWNWWNTPTNWKYINNSGLNLTLWSTDSYLQKVYYTFQNTTTWNYWDRTTYTWTVIENTLCTDNISLGSDNSCQNISQNINPDISHNENYRLVFYAIDEAQNLSNSINIDYIWDTQAPNVFINTLSWSYISDSLEVTGTSSDSDSWISSVNIQIKKWNDFWDGTQFVSWEQSLLTQTNDNYANWSYTFNLPSDDSDGQNYEIIAIANDKAFKDNNSSQNSITITKDSSGPTIWANTITSPVNWDIYSGWENININWSTSNISDSISWLTSSPITLEYFDGTSYQTIVENIPNSGNYLWENIPLIDTNNAIIRITAFDNAQNSSFQNSQWFTIDSTNPSISQIETLENNISNGQINALKIIFSENISDSSINIWDFSINSGSIPITGFSTAGNSNDNEILLLFNPTGNTWDRPTLQYSGTNLSDLAGRKLATTGILNSLDRATPRLQNISAEDQNSNGKLDTIIIWYSENLNTSSSRSWLNIQNAFDGMSISSVNISNDEIFISISESTNINTSTNGLLLDLINPLYTDTNGNSVEWFTDESIQDNALPIKISTQTIDSDENFKADTIVMTFSENIINANINDFTFWNLSTGTTVDALNISQNNIYFQLTETSENNDTENNFEVSYSATNISDTSGNLLANIPTHISDDTIWPKILSRTTKDSNGNWKIDTLEILTSENLNDNFLDINISVLWYTVNTFNTGINNDNIFSLQLEEKNNFDTWVTPNIQIISNNSLWDTNGNFIYIEASSASASDGAWAVIIWARYDEKSSWVSDDTIYVTFSEDIETSSIDVNAWWAWNDFNISNWWWFSSNSISAITSNNTLEITLGIWATTLAPWISKIWIINNQISDLQGNQNPNISSLNQVIVSASVIINEVMFAQNTNDQYIELKNLWSTSVDITGWVIENAGGNGVDITLPSANISWNGYYLIAKTNSSTSILNTSPDFVTASLLLDATSQNNLVFTDWVTVYDTVIANPWPAGNSTTPKAMERKQNPGDGLNTANWYTAEASENFDSTEYKGTPKAENIFDAIAPEISTYFPAQNDVLPTAGHIRFDYSDSWVWVNSANYSITLQKWNGSSYDANISSTAITSTDINNSRAIFMLDDLDSWKYKASFALADNAENFVVQDIIFYIDKFQFKITGNTISFWDIIPWDTTFTQQEVTIEIRTVWKWFHLSQSQWSQLSQWINTIWDFDGNYGFWYDIYSNQNGIINNYSQVIQQINGWNIASINTNINTDWNIQIFTYKIKYWINIWVMQNPWKYSTNVSYILQ